MWNAEGRELYLPTQRSLHGRADDTRRPTQRPERPGCFLPGTYLNEGRDLRAGTRAVSC